MSIDDFWNEFLIKFGKDKSLKYMDAFHFHCTEKAANELLNLVLKGQKKATSSSMLCYEITGDKKPEVGDYSIVTNWNGEPKCVIETVKTTIVPFKDMTFQICKRKGEDEILEQWQRSHREFFMAEGKELGYEFSQDMLVLFEDFRVVFTLEEAVSK